MTYPYFFIDLLFGIIFFLCILKAYCMGVKHGKELNKGIVPKVNINPVKSLKDYVIEKEEKKKSDLEHEGWYGENGIMNYNPYNVKDGE